MAEAKGSFAHLILNPAAGRGAALLGRLTGAARERGIRVRVLEPGEDARVAALEAVEDGADALGIAGGDGSVAAVAGVAAERDVPLVVVPTGTLNHFARDLGLDLARPLRALEAFTPGRPQRRVDIGLINGRHFINNVSLGVYAEMLGDPGYRRDKLRVAQAKLQAAFTDTELRRALRITPPEEEQLEGVVAVVVSNNPYEFARCDRLGQRPRLDTGTLQISVLDASTLDELDRSAWKGSGCRKSRCRPGRRSLVAVVAPMYIKGLRLLTARLPENSCAIGTGLNRTSPARCSQKKFARARSATEGMRARRHHRSIILPVRLMDPDGPGRSGTRWEVG